jgi:hypothetical protein
MSLCLDTSPRHNSVASLTDSWRIGAGGFHRGSKRIKGLCYYSLTASQQTHRCIPLHQNIRTMHAFKFVSLPAAAVLMLLALVQGGVAQGVAEVVEPVPLGGLCKCPAFFLSRSRDSLPIFLRWIHRRYRTYRISAKVPHSLLTPALLHLHVLFNRSPVRPFLFLRAYLYRH